jgi:hypothetical protein
MGKPSQDGNVLTASMFLFLVQLSVEEDISLEE